MADAGAVIDHVAALARLIFNFRLVVLLVTVLYIPQEGDNPVPLAAAWILAGIVSYIPLKWWSSVGPKLVRHPALLFGDLVLSTGILAVTGVASPFFYFTLGTALLSGILYSWLGAALFSALLLGGYWAALWVQLPVVEGLDTFQVLVGNPALYPLAAAGGAAVRGVLDNRARTESALVAASRFAAAEKERARIAREMHDSLAKTLHGISLSATALGAWIKRDPERAARDAQSLARDAHRAAAEARDLIGDLRSHALDRSLDETIADYVARWSERTGIATTTDIAPANTSPSVGWEVLCIVKEALANVERHAGGNKVRVVLRTEDSSLVVETSDDGNGFHPPADLNDLSDDGHFGLVGIRERTEAIGGTLELQSAPRRGTTIRVVVPAPDGSAA